MTTGRSAASRSWTAYSAAAAAFSFALVSLYWAAGGMAALGTIGGTMEASARARDPTVVAATRAAFVLKVLGGLLALALVQPWGRRIPRRALLVAAVGGAAVLMLYGIANTVGVALTSMDVLDNPAGMSPRGDALADAPVGAVVPGLGTVPWPRRVAVHPPPSSSMTSLAAASG